MNTENDLSENTESSQQFCAVISSLEPGGAEFTFIEVIKEAVSAGREVQVVTLKSPSEGELELPRGVSRLSLDSTIRDQQGVLKCLSVLTLIRLLRKILQQNRGGTVLSFMTQTNVLVLLASLGIPSSIYVCERVHPEYSPFLGTSFFRPIKRWIRNRLYSFAKSIVLQSDSMKKSFSQSLQDKIQIIPNFVRAFNSVESSSVCSKNLVLSVGRLVPQKDHITAIQAFALAVAEYPDWEMIIVGSGLEKDTIERERQRLNLGSKLQILPQGSELEILYQSASIFISTSRYEGFPNVVLEAMSFGLPVIATDCPGAASELIQHGKNGSLGTVGDVDWLSGELKRLIKDRALREAMGIAGMERSKSFERTSVIKRWNRLLGI